MAENAKASTSIPQPGSQTQQNSRFIAGLRSHAQAHCPVVLPPCVPFSSRNPSLLGYFAPLVLRLSFEFWDYYCLALCLCGLACTTAEPRRTNWVVCLDSSAGRLAVQSNHCACTHQAYLTPSNLPSHVCHWIPSPQTAAKMSRSLNCRMSKVLGVLHGSAAAPPSGQLQNRVIPHDFMHVPIEEPSFLWICQSPP